MLIVQKFKYFEKGMLFIFKDTIHELNIFPIIPIQK